MIARKYRHVVAVVLLSILGLFLDFKTSKRSMRRFLSYDYGNGNCEWTGATKVDLNTNPYGTLIASYPGAGMRLTWQMTEGAVGYMVGT